MDFTVDIIRLDIRLHDNGSKQEIIIVCVPFLFNLMEYFVKYFYSVFIFPVSFYLPNIYLNSGSKLTWILNGN